jgi:ankyrin repeat protein
MNTPHGAKSTKRNGKLWLLCLLLFIPIFGAAQIREVFYRVACHILPSLREKASEELIRSIHFKSDLNTVRKLVWRGADVNYAMFGPPLANAIRGQRSDIAILLVQSGADPNYRGFTGSTLFYEAATELNSPQLVREMLRNGATIKGANSTNNNPVLVSVLSYVRQNMRTNAHAQIARLLIEAGADVNERASKGVSGANQTPLMLAAQNDDVETIEMLLKRGAKVNDVVTTEQNQGATALMFAAHKQNERAVQLLLRHGANPNIAPRKRSDDISNSALLHVVANYVGQTQKLSQKQRRMVRALLAHGANVNLGNEYSMPLKSVAGRFAPDITREFLRRGAKVNWQSKSGWTALMSAADSGDLPTTELLLQHGANPQLQDENGKTALYWARRQKYRDVVRVLESASKAD